MRSMFFGVAAVAVLLAAACGSSSSSSSSSTPASSGPSPAASSAPAATATSTTKTFPAGSAMAQIVSKGSITIGVKYDVPLMGLFDPVTQKVDGFDIAIGKEIAKDLG